MTITKWSRDREKVTTHWFTTICASLSKGVGMLALLRIRHNIFFYEEPVLSAAHEDVTPVLLPLTSLAVALFHRETNASSMSNRKLSGALYRKRKAKQEQEAQKSEQLLQSFLTKRQVEQSKTSSKIQTLVYLELVDPEKRSVHLTNLNRASGEATQRNVELVPSSSECSLSLSKDVEIGQIVPRNVDANTSI